MEVITFPENRQTTSGLQILLHGVISLPDMTSCYKHINSTFQIFSKKIFFYISIVLKILWKMEHLLLMSKCSIFHNILEIVHFKGVQRCRLIMNFHSFENTMENGAFAPHEQMFHFS